MNYYGPVVRSPICEHGYDYVDVDLPVRTVQSCTGALAGYNPSRLKYRPP
jgi:hypothetical protein